jgi:hypothetical protein
MLFSCSALRTSYRSIKLRLSRRWPSTPLPAHLSSIGSPSTAPVPTYLALKEERFNQDLAATAADERPSEEAGPSRAGRPASLISLERFLRSEWAGDERGTLRFDPWVSIGSGPTLSSTQILKLIARMTRAQPRGGRIFGGGASRFLSVPRQGSRRRRCVFDDCFRSVLANR